MKTSELDLAIIGGGPIGLDAAVRAQEQGWNLGVFEKAGIGNHFRQYRDVQLFTPFEMNRSDASLSFAKKHGITPPDPSAYQDASDYLDQWLLPLAHETPLESDIHTHTRVKSITRESLLKGERIGCDRRGNPPFRLLVENGKESIFHAKKVIDASGTFSQPNPLGTGGIQAPGETSVDNFIERGFPDEQELRDWSDRSILLVGAGYSAATNLLRLIKLKEMDERMEIHWLVRSETGEPISRLEDDPLEKRDELGKKANKIAKDESVNLIRGTEIHRLDAKGESVSVTFTDESSLNVERILANVGYRPDRSIYRELQFHECYGTEGPIDLAATLLSQDGADCLDVDPGGADALENPEPDFYVLGSKSYGRKSNFLLETGFQQVADLFETFEV